MTSVPKPPEQFIREIDTFDANTIRDFADQILYFEHSDEPAELEPLRTIYYRGQGDTEVSIIKTNKTTDNKTSDKFSYTFYVKDLSLEQPRVLYFIPFNRNDVYKYDQESNFQHKYSESHTNELMNYLRKHGIVSEPTLDLSGRRQFMQFAASFAVQKAIETGAIDLDTIAQNERLDIAIQQAADASTKLGLDTGAEILRFSKDTELIANEIDMLVTEIEVE